MNQAQRASPLTFDQLRDANEARAKEWNPDGADLSVEFACVELCGEIGEVCNNVKKMIRAKHGLAGGAIDMPNLRDEIADSVICLDLLARRIGFDLADAVTTKFNKTSEKHGFKTRITF